MKWLSFALLLVAAPAWGQATGGTAAHYDKGNLTVTCETKAAILSFNGSTSHIYCPVGTITIDGLRVVGGSNIYAKNRTAGENYANLYVNIW